MNQLSKRLLIAVVLVSFTAAVGLALTERNQRIADRSFGAAQICLPVPETCNNQDDDCDNLIDEEGVCGAVMTLTPTSGVAGSGISIHVAGIPSTERAVQWWAIASTGLETQFPGNMMPRADGSIDNAYNMPPTTPVGTLRIELRSEESGLVLASAIFTVTAGDGCGDSICNVSGGENTDTCLADCACLNCSPTADDVFELITDERGNDIFFDEYYQQQCSSGVDPIVACQLTKEKCLRDQPLWGNYDPMKCEDGYRHCEEQSTLQCGGGQSGCGDGVCSEDTETPITCKQDCGSPARCEPTNCSEVCGVWSASYPELAEKCLQTCLNGNPTGACNDATVQCKGGGTSGCVSDSQCNPLQPYCNVSTGLCQSTPVGGGGGITCPPIYEPVCGTNGVTYSNECEARKANILVQYTGECKATICGNATCEPGEDAMNCPIDCQQQSQCVDNDRDGRFARSPLCPMGDDCNDNNPNVRPGAIEVCDNLDNNCDGQVDENNICGGPGGCEPITQCPSGAYDLDRVCTNGCEYICTFTGPEQCNGRDDDCNGQLDENNVCGGASSCNDNLDNDLDGLVDMNDPGCNSLSDISEKGTIACDDNLDNDNDLKIDYQMNGQGDPECSSPSDNDENSFLGGIWNWLFGYNNEQLPAQILNAPLTCDQLGQSCMNQIPGIGSACSQCGDGICGPGEDLNNCTWDCKVVDTDGDGVLDTEDACITVVGKSEYQGCPVGDKNIVELHTVNIGGKDSTKVPLADVQVRVFDRNNADFQTIAGSKNPDGSLYGIVFEAAAGGVGSCVTGPDGICFAGEEMTGDYLVIVKYFDPETAKTVYVGRPKSPSDFVDTDANGTADLATKDFQIIKVFKKGIFQEYRGGSKIVVTGSLLEIIAPESAIWEGDKSVYPFIFTSDSEWSVDVCAQVPAGYKITGVYDDAGVLVNSGSCTQSFVNAETKVVAFEVTDVGSPEPSFSGTITVKHKGKSTVKKISVSDIRKKSYSDKAEEALKKTKGMKNVGTAAFAADITLSGQVQSPSSSNTSQIMLLVAGFLLIVSGAYWYQHRQGRK